MDFFNVVTVQEAERLIEEHFADYQLATEEVDILSALDRILAQDYQSTVNVPDFNRSTVDGYAVISSNTFGAADALPALLTFKGQVQMGETANLTVSTGEAVYVPTGGMIPDGADGVVMIEYCEKWADGTLEVHKPIHPGENIVYKGDDIQCGGQVLSQGIKIDPLAIGVMAAIGLSTVKVYQKPRFAILSTGDEIIDLEEKLTVGKIRDINGYALAALINKIGGEVVYKVLVKDDFHALKQAIEIALSQSDLVLLSGGSSVGERDYTYTAINSFAGKGVFIKGVSIKPGKPIIVGEALGKPVFGLPGHPVSAIIAFKALVEFLLGKMLNSKVENVVVQAYTDENLHSAPGKRTYQMVKLEKREQIYYAVPVWGKSGLITMLSNSDGYIEIDDDLEGLNKGQLVSVTLL